MFQAPNRAFLLQNCCLMSFSFAPCVAFHFFVSGLRLYALTSFATARLADPHVSQSFRQASMISLRLPSTDGSSWMHTAFNPRLPELAYIILLGSQMCWKSAGSKAPSVEPCNSTECSPSVASSTNNLGTCLMNVPSLSKASRKLRRNLLPAEVRIGCRSSAEPHLQRGKETR